KTPKRQKPPQRSLPPGFVSWNRETFEKLIARPPEMLQSRFRLSYGLVLDLIQSDAERNDPNRNNFTALREIIQLCHEDDGSKRKLLAEAAVLVRSLGRAGILKMVRDTSSDYLWAMVDQNLQFDFSLFQTLSLYLVEAIDQLEPTAPDYALDLVSVVEAILEDPTVVLMRQVDKAKDELVAQMKADGVPYEERMERLEGVSHPKPGREYIESTFEAFRRIHPWVRGDQVRPKSIGREMFEHYWSFEDYVRLYGLQRSEGVLLRYLSQLYKTLSQSVPERAKTEGVYDVLGYFRTMLERIDTSLLEEWESLLHPELASTAATNASRRGASCFAEAGGTVLSARGGDIFALAGTPSRREALHAQLKMLAESDLERFALFRLLQEVRPDVVIDCVNTATGIAYRNVFKASAEVYRALEKGTLDEEAVEQLLETLYVPRLIRHIQVLYEGMTRAGTRAYVKVGTSGTGGMGLNIPYTHSEEKPSRVLLAKSAMAGAHSMLLFLMARTPGAPITKEIKPAAAIAWKKIAHGPIVRRGEPIFRIDAQPRPLGQTFSTHEPAAAKVRGEALEAVYIDTGENGIFSLEEFAALTTSQQMEFVTPEEIAQYLVFELEGGNTGHDVINALDNAVLGPTYRAGLLRHWALERMNELQKKHGTHSVAFEMLGPPRITKLLFEAHLLQLAFKTMSAVREATAEQVERRLDELVRTQPEVANDVAAVGIPLLLASGEIVRGPKVIVPAEAENEPITPARLEVWVRDGWVDLRRENCEKWIERCRRIYDETENIPEDETSSRHLRNRRFWDEGKMIQPGKVVGWILSVEEHGGRIKQ
ncbi:MAG: DUF3516 domain-containing protein, partial [Thermoanaerobaculia bacterium]|nr:DUF3516 domain-containing protein [Thermoanaerobaculia bacterium]